MVILDTNIAILVRDGDIPTSTRIAELSDAVALTVVTQVELEAGVFQDAANVEARRARTDVLLESLPVLNFDSAAAQAYGAIIAAVGYSRRKILDRMIAAQALAHRATLATTNPADFADIAGLRCEGW